MNSRICVVVAACLLVGWCEGNWCQLVHLVPCAAGEISHDRGVHAGFHPTMIRRVTQALQGLWRGESEEGQLWFTLLAVGGLVLLLFASSWRSRRSRTAADQLRDETLRLVANAFDVDPAMGFLAPDPLLRLPNTGSGGDAFATWEDVMDRLPELNATGMLAHAVNTLPPLEWEEVRRPPKKRQVQTFSLVASRACCCIQQRHRATCVLWLLRAFPVCFVVCLLIGRRLHARHRRTKTLGSSTASTSCWRCWCSRTSTGQSCRGTSAAQKPSLPWRRTACRGPRSRRPAAVTEGSASSRGSCRPCWPAPSTACAAGSDSIRPSAARPPSTRGIGRWCACAPRAALLLCC
jgi:hypothetical protein